MKDYNGGFWGYHRDMMDEVYSGGPSGLPFGDLTMSRAFVLKFNSLSVWNITEEID